MSLDNHY